MLTDRPGKTGWTPPLRRDPDAIKPTAYALIIGFAGDHNATEANRIFGCRQDEGMPGVFRMTVVARYPSQFFFDFFKG
jgi:hypothetical protein